MLRNDSGSSSSVLRDDVLGGDAPNASSILSDALSSSSSASNPNKTTTTTTPWWRDNEALTRILACAGGDCDVAASLHGAEARAAAVTAARVSAAASAEIQAAADARLWAADANSKVSDGNGDMGTAVGSAAPEAVAAERAAFEYACSKKWREAPPMPASSAFAALGSLHLAPRPKQ